METTGEFLRYAEDTGRFIGECASDYAFAVDGKKVIYNLDFSLLRPRLFPEAHINTNPIYPGTKEISHTLLEHQSTDPPYMLAVSGAMYYEFLDSLHHYLIATRNIRSLTRGEIQSAFKDSTPASSILKERLSLLSVEKSIAEVQRPIQVFTNWLQSRKVRGIGDYVRDMTLSYDQVKPKYEEILTVQSSLRLSRDRARRSRQDSIFHYKMDAINICLSLFFTPRIQSKVLFVTPTRANLWSCRFNDAQNVADTVGRHSTVPFFMVKTQQLLDAMYLSNPVQFLNEAASLANDLAESLRPLPNDHRIESLNPHLKKKLHRYLNDYCHLLLSTGPQPSESATVNAERLKEIVGTRRRLEDRVEELGDQVITAAKQFAAHADTIGLGVIEEFPIHDDPILRRMMSTFHLSA